MPNDIYIMSDMARVRKRGKYKHKRCPYPSNTPEYQAWYYKNITKKRRKKG